MKQILLSACVMLLSSVSRSQSFSMSGQLGYAIGKADTWKKFMLLTGGDAGVEWELNYKYSINTGLGFNMLSFTSRNDTGASMFIQRSMLFLPIHLKRKFQVSRTSFIYYQWGIRNSLFFRDKKEIFNLSGKTTERSGSIIVNFGLSVEAGFVIPMDAKWNFGVAFGGYNDLVSLSRIRSQKFKAVSNILNTTFSRKF